LIKDVSHFPVQPPGYTYYADYYRRFGTKQSLGSVSSSKPTPAGTIANPAVFETSGNLTVNGSWNILAGEAYVVFVPGNLTIDLSQSPVHEKITVVNGGFLAFIVRGNIIVSGVTGYTFPPLNPDAFIAPKIAGIYISDGTFEVEPDADTTDPQLIAAGTFVAKTFLLNRDLGYLNSSNPGELFIYRPDLWKNAPEQIKEINVAWQEVAP
jgi:hypothetical protein